MPPPGGEAPAEGPPPPGPRGARRVGAVLLLGGLLAGQAAVAWWRAGRADASWPAWAGLLGLGLVLALLLPLMATGIHLLRQGGRDLVDARDRRDWERLRPLFDADGRLGLTAAVIALQRPRSEVVALLRAAARRGELSGWLDLRSGVCRRAEVAPGRCPRCGSTLDGSTTSGRCRDCGAEILYELPPRS